MQELNFITLTRKFLINISITSRESKKQQPATTTTYDEIIFVVNILVLAELFLFVEFGINVDHEKQNGAAIKTKLFISHFHLVSMTRLFQINYHFFQQILLRHEMGKWTAIVKKNRKIDILN